MDLQRQADVKLLRSFFIYIHMYVYIYTHTHTYIRVWVYIYFFRDLDFIDQKLSTMESASHQQAVISNEVY